MNYLIKIGNYSLIAIIASSLILPYAVDVNSYQSFQTKVFAEGPGNGGVGGGDAGGGPGGEGGPGGADHGGNDGVGSGPGNTGSDGNTGDSSAGPGNGGVGGGDVGDGCCDGGGEGNGPGNGGVGGGDIGDGCCNDGPGGDGPENDGPGNEPNEPPVVVDTVPVCTFVVSDNSIVRGENVTFTWTTQRATSVSISPHFGNVALNDSRVGSPSVTTTYTLTATDADGDTVICPVTVVVTVPPVDVDKVPKCISFLANGQQSLTLPDSGGTITLTWNVQDATKVTINNGVGQFLNNVTSTQVNVTRDTTFVLTATDADNDQDTCAVTIDIDEKEDDKRARCDFFTASPTNVEPGDSVRLEWGTTNVSSVSINRGVGSNLDPDGSVTVEAPNDEGSFTYTLFASNNVNTDDCEVTIYIDDDDDNGGGGGGSSRPRCELDISARTIDRGDRVRLSWETDRADEVTIFEGDEDDGDRIFRTRDDDEVEDGSITVRPDRDTTYTLVAERGSREDICRAKVEVDKDDDVVVLSDRFQTPIVKGITLTQVPYTGFDAGPTLTFIFYALLALWGAFVAYFYIYKREPKRAAVAAAPTYGEASREEFEKKVARLTDLYTGRNLM